MEKYISRLSEMMERYDRFTFDLRSECRIYFGIVGAYRAMPDSYHFADLPVAIAHALEHDSIVSGWRDTVDRKIHYDSCRVFTDLDQAIRFARKERQVSVYNLNRGVEIPVDGDLSRRGDSPSMTDATVRLISRGRTELFEDLTGQLAGAWRGSARKMGGI